MKNKIVNHTCIPERGLKQFQSEIETWKRLLQSRIEENVLLKIRLSDILKNNYDQNWLEEIEVFQSQFIGQDEIMSLLRKDIANLYDLFTNDLSAKEQIRKTIERTMMKLHNDMTTSANNFNHLKLAFNNFENQIYRKNENWN